MAQKIPEQILHDLARKAADDVGTRVRMTAKLLNEPQDAFYIALSATAAAAGAAVGFAQSCGAPEASPEEAVDTLWMVLRPMILITAGGGSADFRALLRAAPKVRQP